MTSVETIKDIRIELDGVSGLIKNLPDSEFTSMALTSSQLSKMWLGKTLKELGNENPYPESKSPVSEKIEPAADISEKVRQGLFEDAVIIYPSEPNGKSFANIVEYLNEFAMQRNYWSKGLKVERWKDMSYIKKVKWLRSELERIENKIFELKSFSPVTYRFNIYSTNSFSQCVEAGMWLGMELGRIREEGK